MGAARTTTSGRSYRTVLDARPAPAPARAPKLRVDPRAREAEAKMRTELAGLAGDQEGFHDLMRRVYGQGYDRAAAEDLRARTLKGDTSWMPEVKVVPDASFPAGGEGAYADGVIYLRASALADTGRAAGVLMEELGHHIDTFVKASDTRGDEGELFRRFAAGEKLSAAQVRAIRAENDVGTIQVDGKTVEVEFFLGKVWNGVKKAAKAVGNAVGNAARSVADGVGKVVGGVVDGVAHVGKGIARGASSAWSHLKKGRILDAAGSFVGGVVSGLGNAGSSVIDGVVRGAQKVVEAPTHLLGGAGRWIRENVTDRAFTAVDRAASGLFRAGTGMIESVVEGVSTVGSGLQSILTGRFGEGFRKIGSGLVQTFVQTPVDGLLLGAGSVLSAGQILLGLESKGRGLTDAEKAHMRRVFGDSVDLDQVRVVEGKSGLFGLNDRAFVHGNTIYMKDVRSLDVLTHEMLHVWQFQNGGTDYMSEALWSQWQGKGYDWEQSVPGTPWSELEPEQQAQLIEDASRRGFFTPGHRNYGVFRYDVDGDGQLDDLTAYLNRALADIRAGAGAP